jgi:hypothetical protein
VRWRYVQLSIAVDLDSLQISKEKASGLAMQAL